MSYQDVIAQIKELLERNLDSSEIAHRLRLDLQPVSYTHLTLPTILRV